jgi:hypothetical protein
MMSLDRVQLNGLYLIEDTEQYLYFLKPFNEKKFSLSLVRIEV